MLYCPSRGSQVGMPSSPSRMQIEPRCSSIINRAVGLVSLTQTSPWGCGHSISALVEESVSPILAAQEEVNRRRAHVGTHPTCAAFKHHSPPTHSHSPSAHPPLTFNSPSTLKR